LVFESSFRNKALKISIPDKIKASLATSSASQSRPGEIMFRVVISPLWRSSSRAVAMRDSISAVMSGLFCIVFLRSREPIKFEKVRYSPSPEKRFRMSAKSFNPSPVAHSMITDLASLSLIAFVVLDSSPSFSAIPRSSFSKA